MFSSLYKNLYKNAILQGHFFLFLKIIDFISFGAAFTNMYQALEKEEIVNLKIFVLFGFLQLRNSSGTYSKYLQNNIYETDI